MPLPRIAPLARAAAAAFAVLAATHAQPAAAQTLTALTHQPPVGVGVPFLLTDGRVMVQGSSLTDWYALTPDSKGRYATGTWTQLASFPAAWNYAPDAFASAVLADGRLVVVGGEYNEGAFALTAMGAIYDPRTNAWAQVAPPAGWANIGDSPSVVLADGRFLVGRKLDTQMAALDPATLTWSFMNSTGKSDFDSEEGWTLMPDGSVLTVDVLNAPNSERYLPGSQMWLSDGSTGVDLHVPTTVKGCIAFPGGCYYPPGEVGPQILRPDGSVFAFGAAKATRNAHTSLYRPGATATDPGTWTPGPDFPRDDAGDTGASLLPNGHVLVNSTLGRLYEYDGSTLTQTVSNAGSGILLPLPSGETLFTSSTVKVYTSPGAPDPAWAPAVTSVAKTLVRGTTYTLKGTQLNGLSQAAALGDEFETSTNYPLVRITNKATGHVVYARTHDHSSMGVATGSTIVSTRFELPAGAETGASVLQVVANGIASAKVRVTVN
jgi:hypothetical protein